MRVSNRILVGSTVLALGSCSPAPQSSRQQQVGTVKGDDDPAEDAAADETSREPAIPLADASFEGCGDRLLSEGEACDDGNREASDGCSDRCQLEAGYACPVVGARCRAAACGDGLIVGDEECEDGGDAALDGCDERCRLEAGWACSPGKGCHRTRCGDGRSEGQEQCDDGASDVPFDGCYACIKEPSCSSSGCKASCGDGIKFPSEACDDGNTRGGDGCSPTCEPERGFACESAIEAPPDHVDLPIIYRDFRGKDLAAVPAASLAAGHVDFEGPVGNDRGLVASELSADKKPVYAKAAPTTTTQSASMFGKWYRDDPSYNRTIVDTVRLTRNSQGAYVFFDASFFPLDSRGFVAEGHEPLRSGSADETGNTKHNFNFTSELRTWFEYKGGEFLEFKGDDDVWVFVNGRLAVDLGGVHGAQTGSVTLDASGADARFAISAGNIYEIVVFQAERHTAESQYQLTLRDFLRVRTSCASVCGDGELTPDEACDDGENRGDYGFCASGCVFGPRCGDGVVQTEQGEECDDQNRVDTDNCSSLCTRNVIL